MGVVLCDIVQPSFLCGPTTRYYFAMAQGKNRKHLRYRTETSDC